jgi:dihydroorotase
MRSASKNGRDFLIRRATIGPALAIERPELGTLEPGNTGDASILRLESGAFDYTDSTGVTLSGEQRLTACGIVVGGNIWPSD